MAILDPVLGWTLALPPILGVLILSLIVTLIINLITKFTTNQKEMKRLKTEIDGYKAKIKESKDNPKKMMKLNQEAMEVNMQYMKHSFKAMFFTFIPIIFIFSWMNGHYTYAPMEAGQPLIVRAEFLDGFDGTASLTSKTLGQTNATITEGKKAPEALFAISGDKGKHDFTINYQKFSYNGTLWLGEKPTQNIFQGKGPVKSITVDYPRIHPLGPFHLGSWYPGWLALYIVFSIVLSMSTRKLMKIY